MKTLVVVLVLLMCGCDSSEPQAEAETEAEPEAEAEAEAEPEAEPESEAEPEADAFVSAAGLTIDRARRVPPTVMELARQGRPSTIPVMLSFSAGSDDPRRVYWLAFETSRFAEARGRAADEGRIEAFDAELERKIAECQETEEVGDCDYCTSQCDSEVMDEIGSRSPDIVLVRVTSAGSPRVDGSQVIYRGDENDDLTLRIRDIDDLDGDGRPEIAFAVEIDNDWPAGDGGHDAERHLVVDADRLNVQIDYLRKREEDGHGGNVVEESRVSFQDRNGDGRADYALRYTRSVGLNECAMFEEGDPDTPEICRGADEARRAHYSVEQDAWLLAEGERWPWLPAAPE